MKKVYKNKDFKITMPIENIDVYDPRTSIRGILTCKMLTLRESERFFRSYVHKHNRSLRRHDVEKPPANNPTELKKALEKIFRIFARAFLRRRDQRLKNQEAILAAWLEKRITIEIEDQNMVNLNYQETTILSLGLRSGWEMIITRAEGDPILKSLMQELLKILYEGTEELLELMIEKTSEQAETVLNKK